MNVHTEQARAKMARAYPKPQPNQANFNQSNVCCRGYWEYQAELFIQKRVLQRDSLSEHGLYS